MNRLKDGLPLYRCVHRVKLDLPQQTRRVKCDLRSHTCMNRATHDLPQHTRLNRFQHDLLAHTRMNRAEYYLPLHTRQKRIKCDWLSVNFPCTHK